MSNNPHSEANFRPEEYCVEDYLDNQPPMPNGFDTAEHARVGWGRQILRYFPTSICGKTAAKICDDIPQAHEDNVHRCIHCGNTKVRYIVAVRHIPSGKFLCFGQDCVARLNFANRDEFKAAQVRARAELGRARLRVLACFERFAAAHPDFITLIKGTDLESPAHRDNLFVRDVIDKLHRYGSLSDAQIRAVENSLARDLQRVAREQQNQERKARATAGPVGRQAVRGTVLAVKTVSSQWGESLKMLVELSGEARVWCTVPSACRAERGQTVEFTATFEQSKDDPSFSFGKRPTGFRILENIACAS